jgi:hypothetical protein
MEAIGSGRCCRDTAGCLVGAMRSLASSGLEVCLAVSGRGTLKDGRLPSPPLPSTFQVPFTRIELGITPHLPTNWLLQGRNPTTNPTGPMVLPVVCLRPDPGRDSSHFSNHLPLYGVSRFGYSQLVLCDTHYGSLNSGKLLESSLRVGPGIVNQRLGCLQYADLPWHCLLRSRDPVSVRSR